MKAQHNFQMIESIFKGALAGFIATIPMTMVMLALYQWLPWHERYPLPPWRITYRMLRRSGAEEHMEGDEQEAVALVNHFGYGAATGALYGLLARIFSIRSIWGGVVFALSVWAGSYLGWLPATRLSPPATNEPARRNILMIASHVVWGSAMGLLFQQLDASSGLIDRVRR
jgi:uncharacterized membrane protein YagU involved in acid resistance